MLDSRPVIARDIMLDHAHVTTVSRWFTPHSKSLMTIPNGYWTRVYPSNISHFQNQQSVATSVPCSLLLLSSIPDHGASKGNNEAYRDNAQVDRSRNVATDDRSAKLGNGPEMATAAMGELGQEFCSSLTNSIGKGPS